MNAMKLLIIALSLTVLGAGCSTASDTASSMPNLSAKRQGLLALTSPAFPHLGTLPTKYSCNGEGVNPPLDIADVPQDAATLALIMSDPDAPRGTFIHWVLFNMPMNTSHIEERTSPEGLIGTNGAGSQGYVPACPPSGTHHYIFDLYALDTTLNLTSSATASQVEEAIQGHILEKTQLIATYGK